MQKLLVFFIALFISFSSISQLNLDSLWDVWNDKSKSDTIRSKAIDMLAWEYLYIQPDSAFYFAQLYFKLAESIGSKKTMASALTTQGASMYLRGDYDLALEYYNKSLILYKEIDLKQGIASSLNNIGIIYEERGIYQEALEHYNESLKYKEEIGNKQGVSITLENIGNIYKDQGDYYKALEFFQKSLKIYEELGDRRGISSAYDNIGKIHIDQVSYVEALKYCQKSFKIDKEIGNKNGMANSLGYIGLIYSGQGNYEEALEYYQKSLKLNVEIGNKNGMANSYNNLGSLYFKQNKNNQAISYGEKALDLAQQLGVIIETRNASDLLYKAYKRNRQSAQSLEMHELYIKIRDSVQSEENLKKLIRYEYEKKVQDQKRKVQDQKRQHEAEKLAHKTQLREEEIIRYSLIAIGVLLVFLILFLILSQRNYKKQKREEFEKLLSQVQLLKADKVLRNVDKSKIQTKFEINIDIVNAEAHHKLNETDWNILMLICDHPTLSNKEIAKEVFLSVDGVRSSFKKMYDLFEVRASGRNKKLALVILVMKISEKTLPKEDAN